MYYFEVFLSFFKQHHKISVFIHTYYLVARAFLITNRFKNYKNLVKNYKNLVKNYKNLVKNYKNLVKKLQKPSVHILFKTTLCLLCSFYIYICDN